MLADVRAVFDPNVLISAVLSPRGTPAELLRLWIAGAFELVVSRGLLDELARALAYPKLRSRISAAEANEFVDWLTGTATMAADPVGLPPVHSSDPDDDYLIALASQEDALLVSGDAHLLKLAGGLPIRSPSEFIGALR